MNPKFIILISKIPGCKKDVNEEIIKALKKQIPLEVKHPIDINGKYNKLVTYCYSCGNIIKNMKYCSNCGQKLKWQT